MIPIKSSHTVQATCCLQVLHKSFNVIHWLMNHVLNLSALCGADASYEVFF